MEKQMWKFNKNVNKKKLQKNWDQKFEKTNVTPNE
jgi:hypothetical protein